MNHVIMPMYKGTIPDESALPLNAEEGHYYAVLDDFTQVGRVYYLWKGGEWELRHHIPAPYEKADPSAVDWKLFFYRAFAVVVLLIMLALLTGILLPFAINSNNWLTFFSAPILCLIYGALVVFTWRKLS